MCERTINDGLPAAATACPHSMLVLPRAARGLLRRDICDMFDDDRHESCHQTDSTFHRVANGVNRFARYGAVRLFFARATFVGGPAATTRPPSLPAPGPRSITQSAPATIRMSCSATTTVFPASTRR